MLSYNFTSLLPDLQQSRMGWESLYVTVIWFAPFVNGTMFAVFGTRFETCVSRVDPKSSSTCMLIKANSAPSQVC